MANIIPRRPAMPERPDSRLSGDIIRARQPGLTAAARIDGAGFAASVAMHRARYLSHEADEAFKASPMGEDSYRAICNAFALVAVSEIQGLAFGGSW